MSRSTWERYIEDGLRAVDTHPDYTAGTVPTEDFATAAKDVIGNILHAAKELHGIRPEDMIASAMSGYWADFEELET